MSTDFWPELWRTRLPINQPLTEHQPHSRICYTHSQISVLDRYAKPSYLLMPSHAFDSRVVANNSASISANALNSKALPLGSSKNIVCCSPGSPSNRT